ncbi:MAG: alpha/beta fold hydrolase [Lactobacillales bacterium]|jgi:dipeptidyl aminopeptidase/acylaminoacyl peptidase|nr:alpha/beta fold hydrolase [Lactobacillales bacterium]
MTEKIKIKNKSGLELTAFLDRHDTDKKQGMALLIGGMGSDGTSWKYEKLRDLFLSLGYAVLRFSHRGCGESAGDVRYATTTAGLEDLEALLHYVRNLNWVDQSKIGFYGNSYGGGLVNLYVARHPGFQFMILTSPCIDTKNRYDTDPTVDLNQWQKTQWLTSGWPDRHYSVYTDACLYFPYNEAAKTSLPTLIIHGEKDEIIPVTQSEKLHTILNESKFIKLPQTKHQYNDQDFQIIIHEIQTWMKSSVL